MSKFDKSADSLNDKGWSGARVDTSPRQVTVVQSVRMSKELNERLLAEARRRGVTPSQVIRDLVDEGLTGLDQSATVRVADVHRVIDTLTRKSA